MMVMTNSDDNDETGYDNSVTTDCNDNSQDKNNDDDETINGNHAAVKNDAYDKTGDNHKKW